MSFNFNDNILHFSSTVGDAMSVMDKSPIGVVFFVDDKKAVIGIMTDGDIRRSILKGADIHSPARDYYSTQFIYGTPENSRGDNALLLNEKIKHLPILDENRVLVDYVSASEFTLLPVMEPYLFGNEVCYLTECIKTNWISSKGPYVTKFENIVGEHFNCGWALATSSGTTALHMALLALEIGPGDEVIVPDLTFAASANAVIYCGAKPVLVDVRRDYWNLDPELIEAAITDRTKAIMPVHLYGHPCDMDPIMALARKYGLYVVEDCAEAMGAKYNGEFVGTIGDIGCFSFFANKMITTGEGGMIITDDEKLYCKMEQLRDHGMNKSKRYWHDVVGYNYRMTNLQAAIGVAQFEQLEYFIAKHREIAETYSESLASLSCVSRPPEMPWAYNVFWLYSILLDCEQLSLSRDGVIEKLHQRGIETRPLFYPLHIQPPYLVDNREFPVADDISMRGISLPSGNNLSAEQMSRVTDELIDILKDYT